MPSLRLAYRFALRAPFLHALVLTAACSAATGEPVDRIDLRAALGVEPAPVGVTVEPESGRRFLFDEAAGLFELHVDGGATLLVGMSDMPDPGVTVRPPYTDLVALGDSRLALTAIGDGFLLDLAAGTLAQHFCYEPGDWQEDLEQRTDAVTYDPVTDLLVAQPRTLELSSGIVLASQIGYYERASGADIAWDELPVDFVAGGMAILPGRQLVLGAGTELHRPGEGGTLELIGDLSRFGVSSVDGLAHDPAADTLLVVDRAAGALVELGLADLGL